MSKNAASDRARGVTWTVGEADLNVRLDKFLAAGDRLASRASAAAAIERGKVFVNDTEASLKDAARRLAAGDVVRVWMDRPGTAKRTPRTGLVGDLDIIFEDDHLIVVNKAPGVLSVPLELNPGVPSVAEQLEHLWRSTRRRPLVVHRIDQDTSGLVMFAKHAGAQRRLKSQFARHEPERVYLAIVYGRPDPASGTWRDRLVWDPKAMIQKQTHPRDPNGNDAVADYRVVESFREASLIEVRLQTGRRNQIRIQARLRGHTLIGEARYVHGPDARRPITFGRQALHAHRLTVRHPADDRVLSLDAPVPADLQELLARLRRTDR